VVHVQHDHVTVTGVRQQQRERTRPVKRGHSVEKLLTSPVEIFGIPTRHLAEIDAGELVGDDPLVMQSGRPGRGQLRASQWVAAGRLTHRGLEAGHVNRSVHAYFHMDAPRLIFAIEVQIQLIEDVQGGRGRHQITLICRRTRIRR
jgi:hypothetical protein